MEAKKSFKTVDEIEKSIARLRGTQSLLNTSHAKQLRLMIGDYSPVVVCDSIYPVAEFKKEYLRRIKYRIIELQYELLEMKNEKVFA